MTYFQIIKKHKNMIGGIAIALVILMCMPFFTIYAIDTMSGGESQMGARTVDNTETTDYDDDYYIEGEPDLPTGAMPIGEPTIGGYVSNSFLSFVSTLGYSINGWYYYMEDYMLPNGQIVKYHIWANYEHDVTFYHKR